MKYATECACQNPMPQEVFYCRVCSATCCNRCANGCLCVACSADPELLLAKTVAVALKRYVARDSGDPDIALALDAIEALLRRWGEAS